MRLRDLFLIACIGLAGCKSAPYCLNCGQTGSGSTGGDGGGDLAGRDFALPPGVDLSGGDGGCVISNNGVEICDGIDNDCNGLVDDNVDPSKLMNDPNNCGMCGHACDYSGIHEFGACMNGTCMPSGCTPGFLDANHDSSDGCEYQCTPTVPPTEVCDGVDNDCNGVIDDGFTATWQSNGQPNYDGDINNCGGCGFVCNLPGAVQKCGVTSTGRGICQVDHCINNPGADTFKHNDSTGLDINVTGCEYHCPVASSTAGDCQAAVNTCTFGPEICNGRDDDCNFIADDNVNDPDVGTDCGDLCPLGMVSNCKGECHKGQIQCQSGVKLCVGSTGPTVEQCDGLDNNCDGLVDEPYTAPSPAGYLGGDPTKPLYNSDAANCGGCSVANNFFCNLPHALSGCHSASPNAQGNCYVVSCASGFNNPIIPSPTPSPAPCVAQQIADSAPGSVNSGAGCWYACGAGNVPGGTEAICDGKDNNCDGCTDNIPANKAPAGICANLGQCKGATIPIVCGGASGWQCNYSTVPGVDHDAGGNLLPLEVSCDGWDNNCNGFCDENFPTVATDPSTNKCAKNAGRQASPCHAGQGVCGADGTFCCGTTSPSCAGGFGVAGPSAICNVVEDPNKATDEVCDGVDNNCNGAVDDFAPSHNKKGYHDPVAKVTVPAGDTSPFGKPGAHTVWVFEYEAARPDSSSGSPGGLSSRACSKQGVQPWSGATEDQARLACTAAGGRLCTAFEWQVSCQGPAPSPSPVWSMTPNPDVYTKNVCNNVERTGGPAVWTTGNPGAVGGKVCSVMWPDSPAPSPIADLSGNLFEWTWTPVEFQSLTGAADATISSTGTAGQMQIQVASIPANGGFSDKGGAGYFVTLSGSASHNGSFVIVSVLDDQTVVVQNAGFPASGGSDANNGAITWSLINTYYKVRGGSFTSPKGGTTCDFDFDIAIPTFTNNDVGFRCCFDNKPCSVDGDCPAATTCQSGLCK